MFHIETDPAGAQVVIGRVIKGVTPLDLELAAVEGRAKADVTLQKDGYLPMTVTAAGSGPRIELVQKLQKVPDEKPPEPPKDVKAPNVDKPERTPPPPKPAVNAIDEAFDGPTPKTTKDTRPPAPLPEVKPAPTPKPKATVKKAPKPASRLDDDEDPLAPHTPPPANDLKRPK
jgi:hypothetical protein